MFLLWFVYLEFTLLLQHDVLDDARRREKKRQHDEIREVRRQHHQECILLVGRVGEAA